MRALRESRELSAARTFALACVMALAFASAMFAQPVDLDVSFKLTDPDNKPLPATKVRLVFGSDPRWQDINAGEQFVTDSNGEAKVSAKVVLDRVMRTMPTNFVGSLMSRPQSTDHLKVGAEIEWASFHWLYVVDVVRFPDGTSMLDAFSIYTRDDHGRFIRKAARDDRGWRVNELQGMLLTAAGVEPSDFSLQPAAEDPAHHWILKLAFKKADLPVRR